MNGDSTITLSGIVALLTIINIIVLIKNSSNNNNENSTKKAIDVATRFTEIECKMNVISQQIAELNQSKEKHNSEMLEENHKISLLSSKIERLFEYKDNLQTRIEHLERGRNKNGKNDNRLS